MNSFLRNILSSSNLTTKTERQYIYHLVYLNDHRPVTNLNYLIDYDTIVGKIDNKAHATKVSYIVSVRHVLNIMDDLSDSLRESLEKYNLLYSVSSKNTIKYKKYLIN